MSIQEGTAAPGRFERAAGRAPALITALPLVLVNAVAVMGQYGYLSDHINWPPAGVGMFAAALESIALYLAYMAHKALVSLDSSFRLRVAAYGYGLLAGFMNYSHYCPDFRPSFVGIATGLMSMSSPILWGIYSRRQSRDRLRELGLIEPGAVRLGINRWLWHFRDSFSVYRFAAWEGIRDPQAAIAAWEARQGSRSRARAVRVPAASSGPREAIPADPAPAIPAPAARQLPAAPASSPAGPLDAAELAACGSDAARVRLAVTALATTAPGPIMAALDAAGHPVRLEAARSALKKVRKGQRSGNVRQLRRDISGG